MRTLEKVQGRMENSLSMDGHTIHLREIDECLLRLPSIVDYTVHVYETRLHVTVIRMQTTSDEVVQKEVEDAMRSHFPFVHELCIETHEDDHSLTLTNSMIKRKLHDCRQGATR